MLDFSKAFDKVPHKKLLWKLDHYGVRGNLLNWVEGVLITIILLAINPKDVDPKLIQTSINLVTQVLKNST